MALYRATETGDLRKVQDLLSLGVDPNASEDGLTTPLNVACRRRHDEIVRVLLRHGAALDQDSGDFDFPLHAAVAGGSPEIVKLLIQAGANVNIQTLSGGKTPLMDAINSNQMTALHIVEILLENRADINLTDDFYGTALIASAYGKNYPVLRLLLRMGADPNVEAGQFGTALMVALIPKKPKFRRDATRMQMVSLLLKYGADPNVILELPAGNTDPPPLHAAMRSATSRDEGFEMTKLLFEYGADANIECVRYGTALSAALALGDCKLAKLLLDNGANVNFGGRYDSPLIAAVSSNSLAMVELLIERGAQVNAIDGEYGTALHTAAGMGNVTLLRHLVENGADVNIIAGKYGSVLSAAAYAADENLDILLDGHSRQTGISPEQDAIIKGVDIRGFRLEPEIIQVQFNGIFPAIKEIFEFLLPLGVDPNAHGTDYGAPLHIVSAYFVEEQALELTKLLLRYGADVNYIGGKFCTALHAAAYKGHVDLFHLLLESGAEASIHDDNARIATDLAGTGPNAARIMNTLLGKSWVTWDGVDDDGL